MSAFLNLASLWHLFSRKSSQITVCFLKVKTYFYNYLLLHRLLVHVIYDLWCYSLSWLHSSKGHHGCRVPMCFTPRSRDLPWSREVWSNKILTREQCQETSICVYTLQCWTKKLYWCVCYRLLVRLFTLHFPMIRWRCDHVWAEESEISHIEFPLRAYWLIDFQITNRSMWNTVILCRKTVVYIWWKG